MNKNISLNNQLEIIRRKKRRYSSKLDIYRAELEQLRRDGATLDECTIFLKACDKQTFKNIAYSTLSRRFKKWKNGKKQQSKIVLPS